MHLRYINKLGIPKDIELTGEPISIGRSREAGIPLLDDKVSRVHCGIRLSEGEFYLKDLKARNGTFVNGKRVEDTIQLKEGDRIQVGSTIFVLEAVSTDEEGEKARDSVQNAMGDGKGYSTILKEIVEDIEPAKKAAPAAPAAPEAPKPAKSTLKIGKPTIKVASSIKISPTPKAEAPEAPAKPAPAPATGPGGRKKIIIKM
jgi:pSer/pThr/pTyr-binding forkhead associated (FHA) protein